jgi:hypothetical protein
MNGFAKENGSVRAPKNINEGENTVAGAWQKPKTRKKGGADQKASTNGVSQYGGEQLPKNDADRKGG